MNLNGKNKVSAEIEVQVLKRFQAGQTNITALAKEFNLARDTVYRIVKNDPDQYKQAIARTREEAAKRRKIQQQNAAQKCKKQKRSGGRAQDEHSRAVCEYFWRIKCTEDDYGRYSEFKTAEHFGMSLPDVIEILRLDPEYRDLEEYRERVITEKMAELQRQNAVSMSKQNRINRVQAVMLNLNVYKLSANKKAFVYTYPAARPVDMPRQLVAKIPWFDYGREVEEKARKEEWNSETEQKATEGDKPVPDSEESNGKKKKKKKHKKKK